MVEVLRDFGFATPELSPALFLKQWSIVRMGRPPMRIEVTTTISGVDFDECHAERVVDQMDDIEVHLIV